MRSTEDLIADLAQTTPLRRGTPSLVTVFGAWVTSFVLYIGLLLCYFSLRPDLIEMLRHPLFLTEILTLAALLLTTALAAAILSFPDMYQKRYVFFLPFVVFGAFVVVMALSYIADRPPAPEPAHAMECLLCICGLSTPPALGMLYWTRRMATTHPMLSGLSCCLAAFSIGALVLRLHEPTDSILHVIRWHYMPMLAIAFVGILIGKKLFRW